MNVNSSTYYSASSAKSSSNKGLSGMMSGMDTEAMVEKMLSGTQNKIDKQEQLKQQTLWKQEIYRDIITNVNNFYSKFFDSSYGSSLKNNFASDSFFNSMVSSVRSGDALRVISTSSNARAADMKVAVKQLASTSALQSGKRVSPGEINGAEIDNAKLSQYLNKTVSLKVDGTDIKVNLNNVTTESEMLKAFNDKLSPEDVTAKVVNGRLRFVTDNPAKVVALDGENSSELGLTMSGLSEGLYRTEGEDLDGNKVGILNGGTIQPNAGPTMSLVLDGVTKNISLNDVADKTTGEITAESVMASVKNQVKLAFGDYITVEDTTPDGDGKLKLNFKVAVDGGKGHELRVAGMDAGRIGLTAGASTQLNTSSTLGDLKDVLGFQGSRFSFSINGENFSFTSEQSLSTVINTVNNSKAGVKLSYSALSDSFRMEATSSGSKYGIDIKQTEGNFFNAILNDGIGADKIAAGSSVGSGWLTTGTVPTSTGPLMDGHAIESGAMSMTVNGRNYTFSLPDRDTGVYTKWDIQDNLNLFLEKNFGKTGDVQNIRYNTDTGELETQEGYAVSFAPTKVDLDDPEAVKEAKKSDLGLLLGFTTKASTNIANGDTKLVDVLGMKGITDFTAFTSKDGSTVGADTALDNLKGVTIDGVSYDLTHTNGRLNLKRTDGGTGTVDFTDQAELGKLFGGSATLGNGELAADVVSAGKDAEVYINGVYTTRSSNNFTIDGVTMELTKVSAADAANTATGGLAETVIGTSRDTDTIVDGFKSFVEEYNKMLDKVSGYLYEDADYRDYPPLTAAQRSEMSESEIVNWEKKAKTGLIRSDDTVTRMISSLRSALYSKPEGSEYALYNIGIETTDGTKTGGRLQLDEAALRDALSADPDAVRQLFTNTTEGLSKQFMSTMDGMAKTKGANPGILVQMAGMPNTTSEKSSSMYVKLKEIETRVKELKVKYEKERARYWNQFNSMESVLANYNSQSAYFAQQFGGY